MVNGTMGEGGGRGGGVGRCRVFDRCILIGRVLKLTFNYFSSNFTLNM